MADSDSDDGLASAPAQEHIADAAAAADAAPTPPKRWKIDPTRTRERLVASVDAPPAEPLSAEQLWDVDTGLPRPDVLAAHFRREGKIALRDAYRLVVLATSLFACEHTLLELDGDFRIVGDTHGQFYDVMTIFEVGGSPLAGNRYVFLGDYVDRGTFAIEIVLLLFAYKVCRPRDFFMLRGNHESRNVTEAFGFQDEVDHKYGLQLYDLCMEAFDALPLAAVIDQAVFCVHGGLSPRIRTLADVQRIRRFREPPEDGAMCDLLWADPIDEAEEAERRAEGEACVGADGFYFNSNRGCSFNYGPVATRRFLADNGLKLVVRAHEAQDTGFCYHGRHADTGQPMVVTVFSCPNYIDTYDNRAAMLFYSRDELDKLECIKQFDAVEHPYVLPDYMDVFTWSVPFVCEKTAQIIHELLTMCEEMDDGDELEGMDVDQKARMKLIMKRKVQASAKMMMMYATLRKEREAITQLKGLVPGGRLPAGVLSGGADAIQQELGKFKAAKKIDAPNEIRRPLKEQQRELAVLDDEDERYAAREQLFKRKASSMQELFEGTSFEKTRDLISQLDGMHSDSEIARASSPLKQRSGGNDTADDEKQKEKA